GLPAVGTAADDVVRRAWRNRGDDLVLGRAAGRDVDDRYVGALHVGDVEPGVGRVRRHATRVHANVDRADEGRCVAVRARDVEHLDLVEVLVAQVGACAGTVELYLGLHAEPPRHAEHGAGHAGKLGVGRRVDDREGIVETVYHPGTRRTAGGEDLD